MPDPIGETIESTVRPNGLEVAKVRVPLGTVFFIYESRPNVTADAAAICVKSGNAVILRGGKEARHSSAAIVDAAARHGRCVWACPPTRCSWWPRTDRAAVGYFLELNQYIDVAIPRGGASLIRRVTEEATMPVIKHFDGNCHVYVDASADSAMAVDIVDQRQVPAHGRLQRVRIAAGPRRSWPARSCRGSAASLREHGVEIRGDAAHLPADWRGRRRHRAGLLRRVSGAADLGPGRRFAGRSDRSTSTTTGRTTPTRSSPGTWRRPGSLSAAVDSAAVMVNASTRFNDGGEFGLGAEIGISTDKFHARGPCGLKELTSYKYVVYGNGQVRT